MEQLHRELLLHTMCFCSSIYTYGLIKNVMGAECIIHDKMFQCFKLP